LALFILLVLMNAFPIFISFCPCLSITDIDNIYLFITFTLFPLLFCFYFLFFVVFVLASCIFLYYFYIYLYRNLQFALHVKLLSVYYAQRMCKHIARKCRIYSFKRRSAL
jgi:hypothetical protein